MPEIYGMLGEVQRSDSSSWQTLIRFLVKCWVMEEQDEPGDEERVSFCALGSFSPGARLTFISSSCDADNSA